MLTSALNAAGPAYVAEYRGLPTEAKSFIDESCSGIAAINGQWLAKLFALAQTYGPRIAMILLAALSASGVGVPAWIQAIINSLIVAPPTPSPAPVPVPMPAPSPIPVVPAVG